MESLFQALTSTADGAFVINENRHIIYWNQAAQKILGYSDDETINQPCYKILAGHNDQCQPICHNQCHIAMAAFSGGTVRNYDMCLQAKSGEERWLNMSTFTFPSPKDETGLMLVHLFRDATQKKQTEQFVYQLLEALENLQNKTPLHSTPPRSTESPIADLTDRERQVLSLLAQGSSTTNIAHSLSISPATVRNHIRNIRQKLHVHTKLEAVVYAFKHGLVS